MIRVYVAGPYTAPTPAEVLANVHAAMDVGDELEDLFGVRAVIPHLAHFRHERRPRTYEEWMERCFHDLATCEGMFRIRKPSSGAGREEVFARDNAITICRSMREVEQWMGR